MRDMTFSHLERLGAATAEADETFLMDEDAFRLLYERTARPLWAYLARTTGDTRLAEDLLQETYYRFLRARAPFENDDHRRHYLFRIATNLALDVRRRTSPETVRVEDTGQHEDPGSASDSALAARLDLARAMGRLRPRERSLLWLAYAQGWSHQEIARIAGVKTGSVKQLLFRARRRLASLLGRGLA